MKNFKLTRRKFLQSVGLGTLGLMLPKNDPVEGASIIGNPNTPMGRILRYKLQIHEEPDVLSKSQGMFLYDDMIKDLPPAFYVENIYKKKIGWYRLASDQYVEAAWVQPVYNRPNKVVDEIPEGGRLGEITMAKVPVYHQPGVRNIHRTFYYENTFWVIGKTVDENDVPWYELWDDLSGVSYFVRATAIRMVTPEELTQLSPEVAPDAKRLELDLTHQIVRAFEYDRQVFEAPVSSGEKDGSTPIGVWTTHRKRPCRRMVNEPHNPNVYDLPGVPWVSYITILGVAFHGAYWHSNWGNVMSNGCINMKSMDAKWIYRWTNPVVPYDQFYYTEETGTRCDVISGWNNGS